jgi:polysaccharide pyruvyl transferase WcaK-like protein
MKIGIITTHYSLNSGAVLQAYASQLFLTSLGHEVEFINYKGRGQKRTIKAYVSKSLINTLYKWQDMYNGYKYSKDGEFNKVLNIGAIQYQCLEDLQKNPPKCDLYYAGSDQIWTVGSRKQVTRHYYLDFGGDAVKRISYAASLGQGIVPEEMRGEIKELLNKFDHISVRETSGVEVIQSIVGESKKVHHVVDPTLLLKSEDYDRIVEDVDLDGKFMVCYSLATYEDEQNKILNYIKGKTGLPIKNLRNPDTCIRVKKSENIIVTPYQWLAYIKKSEFVICTSFHAVVFSLIYHKPFVVISPYVNQRIMSLLGLVNMEERFIETYDKNKIDNLLSNTIDWAFVDDKLTENRQSSEDYLKNALKN